MISLSENCLQFLSPLSLYHWPNNIIDLTPPPPLTTEEEVWMDKDRHGARSLLCTLRVVEDG